MKLGLSTKLWTRSIEIAEYIFAIGQSYTGIDETLIAQYFEQ